MSAITDNQFILDLMPKYPIYVDLLPPEAREVIGRCHAEGVGAYKLLEWEGFQFDRTVDIFDGGPLVATQRRHLRTIRESRIVTLEAGQVSDVAKRALVSTNTVANFRTAQANLAVLGENRMAAHPELFEKLKIKPGTDVRVWIGSK